MRWDRYFEPADRIDQVVFGLVLLAAAGFLGYFGIKGAIAYIHGSRAGPSDPLACGIGILGGLGGGYLSLRLLTGWHAERALIPNAFLLCAGLGAVAGSVWFLSLTAALHDSLWSALGPAMATGAAGVAAVVLWWRRTRGQ